MVHFQNCSLVLWCLLCLSNVSLLAGRLKKCAPSRIINVSSLAHGEVRKFDVDDLGVEEGYKTWKAYNLSKLCNVLFTRELADKLAGTGKQNISIMFACVSHFSSPTPAPCALFTLFSVLFLTCRRHRQQPSSRHRAHQHL